MTHAQRGLRGALLALPALLPFLLPPAAAAPQDPTAPFPRRGEYLGKAACQDCHEEAGASLRTSVHAEVLAADLLHGCETCHGPGAAHGENQDNDPRLITHPPSLPAAQQTAVCVQCHRDQIERHGGDPQGFLAAGKGCTACHKVHEKRPTPAHAELAFSRRLATLAVAKPVGAQRCVQCHPLRDARLQTSHHAALAADADPHGCETCHGNGSLHVETGGIARLITRPDRADDAIATCRRCHVQVDAQHFHWPAGDQPLLSADATCTTCHRVHEPVIATVHAPTDGETTNALCARCHQPAACVLDGTVHASLAPHDRPLAEGCGACHRGAREHALAGGRAALVDSLRGTDAAHQLAVCSACHGAESALRHARVGAHQRHDVTCLTCHSPAAPAGDVRLDAEKRCAECHRDVAAQFRMPNHHPVPEGRMGCSDCHNSHAARPKLRDLELRQAACVRCHGQYQGPFVFTHQASRSDGCTVCHLPHGASNRRMLTQHTAQQNCLQCHADFPAFHDQTSGAVFTNCLNCHTQVHGSNHSRFLFR